MYQHIMVPLDESELAEAALACATAVARPGHTRLTLLRVLEPPRPGPLERPPEPVSWELATMRAASYLGSVAARIETPDLPIECLVLEGDPALSIATNAAERDVDLVTMATHGMGGFSGHDLGSVASRSALKLKTNLLLVRSHAFASPEKPGRADGSAFRRVMIPLDGSVRAEAALPHGLRVAESAGADLDLVQVVEDRRAAPSHASWADDAEGSHAPAEDCEAAERAAQRYLRRLSRDHAGRADPIETHVIVANDVSTALHDHVRASGADLVVMSAHGRSGSVRWRYGGRTLNMMLYGTTALLVVQDRPATEIRPSPAELKARERKGH